MFKWSREYVVSNFPRRPTSSAEDSFQYFKDVGIVKTRLWGEYDFASGDIWNEELTASVRRYFHSWLFMSDWITLSLSNEAVLSTIVETARLWMLRFSDIDNGNEMFHRAYHGEGTAQRARNALRLHFALTTSGINDEDTERLLEHTITQTAHLLKTEDFYTGLDNHGMFQSLALRDIAAYATWLSQNMRAALFQTANTRLFEYFDAAYTSEGVHIEHSPSYHLMVLRDIKEHVAFLRAIDGKGVEKLESILEAGTNHATHTILPSGVFLPLSDTQQKSLRGNHNNVAQSQAFAYASSEGKKGVAPDSRTLIEPKSGYFFHRSAWGTRNARYLAFIAAYNGDYHKHSDDLHVYLWGRGHELLSESGPYGYDSKDPFVRYGYSQWAHNSVIVDSQSLPRVDGKFDSVGIDKISNDANIWTVQGHNKRHSDVEHIRTLELDDSISNIQVVDDLYSPNQHQYTLIWNVGPSVNVELATNTVIGRIEGHIVFVLSVHSEAQVSVQHFRGKGGSRPLGWRFPQMNEKIPSSLLSFSVRGKNVRLVTTVEVVNPAGMDGDAALARPRNVHNDELERVQTTPVIPHYEDNALSLVSRDPRITHAVVKLFTKQGQHSRLTGQIRNMRWDNLPNQAYRMRIFPKNATYKYKPYTTEWFRIE